MLFVGLAAAVACYYEWSTSLWNASAWLDVAWIWLVLFPAMFGFVYLSLPLRRWRGALPAGLALGLVSWGLQAAGLGALANFGKLAGATLVGFWFLRLFETLGKRPLERREVHEVLGRHREVPLRSTGEQTTMPSG